MVGVDWGTGTQENRGERCTGVGRGKSRKGSPQRVVGGRKGGKCLSLLLVLSLAPRGFSPGTPVFPSP